MLAGIDPKDAIVGMAILAMASVLGLLLFDLVNAWGGDQATAGTWVHWLYNSCTDTSGNTVSCFAADQLNILEQLPVWIIIANILVAVSMACPVSIRIGR